MPKLMRPARGRKLSGPALSELPASNAPILRLNRLCPYSTMFPLAFPFDLLQPCARGAWILDPFCGRGTTIYAARLRGIAAVGIDSNPVAAAISGAKLVYVRPSEVIRLAKSILDERQGLDPSSPPSDEFWARCFADST